MNELKVLLDTNVILDFFLSHSPREESAGRVFELAYKGEIAAYTTASSITDIYYIVSNDAGFLKAEKSNVKVVDTEDFLRLTSCIT